MIHTESMLVMMSLLTVTLLGKSEATIDCVQCSDCPDDGEMPVAKECKSITFFEELNKYIPGASSINTDAPVSCFKMIAKIQDKEIISRGCAGKVSEVRCMEKDKITICACEENGCNGSPKSLVPSAVFTLLLVAFLLMVTCT